MYDLSCDVVLFVADGFYGVKSPDRRVISGPIDGRACPGPERARNRLKCLRVFLHSKVCREEWHDVATPPLFRLAEYGKLFLVLGPSQRFCS